MSQMTFRRILHILQADVTAATKELRIVNDRLLETFQGGQEESLDLTALGWTYQVSAEKAHAAERLRLALERLHQFEVSGKVPDDLPILKSGFEVNHYQGS